MWVIVAGIAVVVTGIADINDVQSRHATILGQDISPSVGWGLWLTVVGGGAMVISGIAMIRQRLS